MEEKQSVLERLGSIGTPATEKKKKKSYKDRNGTTRVGDALRWLRDAGKTVAPELLELAGSVTGIEGLRKLGDAISGDPHMTTLDKEYALKQLELDMVEAEQITKRWQADMGSDSWLSKNIRPLILGFLIFTTIVLVILDSAIDSFVVDEKWMTLLVSLDLTALGGYFTLREVGKGLRARKMSR